MESLKEHLHLKQEEVIQLRNNLQEEKFSRWHINLYQQRKDYSGCPYLWNLTFSKSLIWRKKKLGMSNLECSSWHGYTGSNSDKVRNMWCWLLHVLSVPVCWLNSSQHVIGSSS
jgi:hypothetical protein